MTALGHSHPRVVGTMREQAATLLHVSNLFYIPQQIHLAKLLCDHSFADRVFFSNSGAEANETAIKLARKKWAKEHGASGPRRHHRHPGRLSRPHPRHRGGHGARKDHHGFEPLPGGFKYVPFNDLRAVERAVDQPHGGRARRAHPGGRWRLCSDDGYLAGLRKLYDEQGIALIFDEIQTGMGQTARGL